jgi:two-component system NtrC family sensor kinase
MNILLAEDDRVFQILLSTALARWGYKPVLVEDGEQAWHLLSSSSGPRLAILDCVMPLADGLEVCRRVRGGNVPHYVYIILLTSKTHSNDLVAGLEAGADDYLAKPVNLIELKQRLRAGCRVLEAEERHRIIAETASDGIVLMENEDIIHFANSAAAMIFGYAVAELVGQGLSQLVPGFKQRLERTSPNSTSRNVSVDVRSWSQIEIAGNHRSGRELILEASFSESMDDSHRRILSAVIRDVTEHRQLEGQRAQIQKLESIGQLAAGVAHEINTPIQYIGDNLRFIEGSYGSLSEGLES